MRTSKSLPPDVGKVAPKATDEEYTQKSAELFADPSTTNGTDETLNQP